ncbi:TetR family transcriptional regulator, partial [Streptomyces sp. TRM76130]|nr:TetR family transcriptional regulator [Streptomyces sp. TRM76130]
LSGEEALQAMGYAYSEVIMERPERLLMQMQMYLTVGAAEQAGDHAFGEVVRAGWVRLWDTAHALIGGDVAETGEFMAKGMLINCLVAMGFPPGHRVWEGVYGPSGSAECREGP